MHCLASYKNCCYCSHPQYLHLGVVGPCPALDRSWQVTTCGCHQCHVWSLSGMRWREAGFMFIHPGNCHVYCLFGHLPNQLYRTRYHGPPRWLLTDWPASLWEIVTFNLSNWCFTRGAVLQTHSEFRLTKIPNAQWGGETRRCGHVPIRLSAFLLKETAKDQFM